MAEYKSVFDVPPIDVEEYYKNIRDGLLETEEKILATDREFYLECMNGKTLKERDSLVEIRDGLILYFNIYRWLKDN